MPRDSERLDRLQTAMKETGLDALVCALPENVLLLTGYFPVVGASLAIATRDRETILFVPSDEMDLAEDCAHEVIPFEPGSLDVLTGPVQAVREPLRERLRQRHLESAVIGYECGAAFAPAPYASMHLYGNSILELFQGAVMRPASELLSRMKAVLTTIELDRVRRASRIAAFAFEEGVRCLAPGRLETEAAMSFRTPLVKAGVGFEGVRRADGFVFCMSGPNSGNAYGAFARLRCRPIEVADFVLTHCNSYADGYWTDITRTYCIQPADDRQRKMYDAVLAARAAALDAVRPGVKAASVDGAARDVLRAHGFADQFKHSTGHGVGFAAIDHNARPRLHPASDERLETGMVFNVEPGIYFERWGGLRHCDMVAVTETGAELLTPFHSRVEELIR
jgi:Xaa-Pro dipeptidase